MSMYRVRFLGHHGVLVRRPRRPVAWLAEGHAGHDPSRLDVLAEEHIEFAARAGPPVAKCRPGSFLHTGERDELTRVVLVDRRGDFAMSQPDPPGAISNGSARGT